MAIPLLTMLLAGCTTANTQLANNEYQRSNNTALLLVSMEDGSIIAQQIDLPADVCMKSISDPRTTCFHQGAPIIQGQETVAYEMTPTEHELYGD
ncbi:MAG: hypothetical protein HKN56_02310 [Gammaproteobacteria bacterium]|nr:hypothetical protein [Gammaproteobacteria bacterium]